MAKKKPPIPPTMRITGLDYTILDDPVAIRATQHRGQWLGDSLEVLLDTKLPLELQRRTLFHEGLHGIFENSPLEKDLSEELEERIVILLEREVPDFIRDNPWLTEGWFA